MMINFLIYLYNLYNVKISRIFLKPVSGIGAVGNYKTSAYDEHNHLLFLSTGEEKWLSSLALHDYLHVNSSPLIII